MRQTFTNSAYAAILRTLQRGGVFVARDPHCSLATVLAIYAGGRRGELRERIDVNARTGQRTHITTGVALNRAALTAMRDQIRDRGDQIPDALLAALEDTAPAPRRPRVSITQRADPFALIGVPYEGESDDIPF